MFLDQQLQFSSFFWPVYMVSNSGSDRGLHFLVWTGLGPKLSARLQLCVIDR